MNKVINTPQPRITAQSCSNRRMLVGAAGGSGLMERSKKPGSDPIFGDGISPT